MDILVQKLLNFIGNTSSITGVIGSVQAAQQIGKEALVKNKIESFDSDELENLLEHVEEEINREELDKLLTSYINQFKDNNVMRTTKERVTKELQEQADTQITGVIEDKKRIRDFIAQYVNRLFDLIQGRLTYGEELLLNESTKMNNELKQVSSQLAATDNKADLILKAVKELGGKTENEQNLSKSIEPVVDKLNLLMRLIEKKFDIKLAKQVLDADKLIKNDAENIIIRLNNYMNRLDIRALSQCIDLEGENLFELIYKYFKNTHDELMLDIDEFYHKTFLPTVACYENYEEKDATFYTAVGAIGLFATYSDEKLVDHIFKNIDTFINYILRIISEVQREHPYEEIEEAVVGRLNNAKREYILSWLNSFSDDPLEEKKALLRKEMLRVILNEDSMLDIEVAQKVNCPIKEVRKELFYLLGKVIRITYNDTISTKISLVKGYRDIAEQICNEEAEK